MNLLLIFFIFSAYLNADETQLTKNISIEKLKLHPDDIKYLFDIDNMSCISTKQYLKENLDDQSLIAKKFLKKIPKNASVNWCKNFGSEIIFKEKTFYTFKSEYLCRSFEKILKNNDGKNH